MDDLPNNLEWTTEIFAPLVLHKFDIEHKIEIKYAPINFLIPNILVERERKIIS